MGHLRFHNELSLKMTCDSETLPYATSSIPYHQEQGVSKSHCVSVDAVVTKKLRLCVICTLVAKMVKNAHAMRETRVQSLGQEDPLEKGIASHSSILAWKIP